MKTCGMVPGLRRVGIRAARIEPEVVALEVGLRVRVGVAAGPVVGVGQQRLPVVAVALAEDQIEAVVVALAAGQRGDDEVRARDSRRSRSSPGRATAMPGALMSPGSAVVPAVARAHRATGRSPRARRASAGWCTRSRSSCCARGPPGTGWWCRRCTASGWSARRTRPAAPRRRGCGRSPTGC